MLHRQAAMKFGKAAMKFGKAAMEFGKAAMEHRKAAEEHFGGVHVARQGSDGARQCRRRASPGSDAPRKAATEHRKAAEEFRKAAKEHFHAPARSMRTAVNRAASPSAPARAVYEKTIHRSAILGFGANHTA